MSENNYKTLLGYGVNLKSFNPKENNNKELSRDFWNLVDRYFGEGVTLDFYGREREENGPYINRDSLLRSANIASVEVTENKFPEPDFRSFNFYVIAQDPSFKEDGKRIIDDKVLKFSNIVVPKEEMPARRQMTEEQRERMERFIHKPEVSDLTVIPIEDVPNYNAIKERYAIHSFDRLPNMVLPFCEPQFYFRCYSENIEYTHNPEISNLFTEYHEKSQDIIKWFEEHPTHAKILYNEYSERRPGNILYEPDYIKNYEIPEKDKSFFRSRELLEEAEKKYLEYVKDVQQPFYEGLEEIKQKELRPGIPESFPIVKEKEPSRTQQAPQPKKEPEPGESGMF